MTVPSLPESPEGAREVMVRAVYAQDEVWDDVEGYADLMLSALSEAGYTVARLERVVEPAAPGVLVLDQRRPLYRIVAPPVAPPESREAQ